MHAHEGLIERCLRLCRAGLEDEAVALAREAVEAEPEDGAVWQFLGLLERDRGDYLAARTALETALVLTPLSHAARCALGDCYRVQGEVALAAWVYQGLAEEGDSPTQLLPTLAAGLGAVGSFATALVVCRELVRRDPARHEGYFGIAFYLRRLGHDVEEVLEAVRRAHWLEPASVLYRVTLALMLDHLGREGEARELVRDLPREAFQCCGCLGKATTVFQAFGDLARIDALRSDPGLPD